MPRNKDNLVTRLLHEGEEESPYSAHAPPLYETSTFAFSTIRQARQVFNSPFGYVYSRIDNPTLRLLERKLAVLEGEAALSFRSGMAAITTSILALAGGNGCHIVCNYPLYSGTKELFCNVLARYGLEFSFVDARDPENVRTAIRANTTIIYLETPTNPTLFLADIKEICQIRDREKQDVLVLVDNTFATPYNQQSLKLGANLSIHSLTKYLSGFGDVIGGAVMGSAALLEIIRRISIKIGANASARDAAVAAKEIKTFTLRMERHNANALKLARFLESQASVEKVYYPGLKSNPQYELAIKQMRTPKNRPGFGGMVSFELKTDGDQEKLDWFLDRLPIKKGVSLGFVDTIVEHPATMTHGRIPAEEREKEGISYDLIRVSVGIEDFSNIKRWFKQGLRALR